MEMKTVNNSFFCAGHSSVNQIKEVTYVLQNYP